MKSKSPPRGCDLAPSPAPRRTGRVPFLELTRLRAWAGIIGSSIVLRFEQDGEGAEFETDAKSAVTLAEAILKAAREFNV